MSAGWKCHALARCSHPIQQAPTSQCDDMWVRHHQDMVSLSVVARRWWGLAEQLRMKTSAAMSPTRMKDVALSGAVGILRGRRGARGTNYSARTRARHIIIVLGGAISAPRME
eukprot:5789947-Pyramimonas_sp.AAC.1